MSDEKTVGAFIQTNWRVGGNVTRVGISEAERAVLAAAEEWREADRASFVAKAAYIEASGGKASAMWLEVVRLKKVEEEKRALLMAAVDALRPEPAAEEG